MLYTNFANVFRRRKLSAVVRNQGLGRVAPRRNIDDQWVSDAIVGLEEFDGGGMARSRSESTIPCN